MTSTERPQEGTAESGGAGVARRRRPRFAVATVAAAVLIAGGGGAYFATSAFGGGAGPTADGGPPPLALDALEAPAPGQVGAAGPTAGGAAAGESAPAGIAPGEPDPGGVTYRAKGKLPQGPGTARVYRTSGAVTAADVTRLAKALGLTGAPRSDGTAWKVGTDKDGSGPLLSVARQAPGTWTYAQFGRAGGDNCLKGKACPSGGSSASGTGTGRGTGAGTGTGTDTSAGAGAAVSEAAAKKAAAPVLKALGQSDADLDAGQLMGSTRVVNADPVVGGLPTYGWSTGIQVGTDGQVIGGSGQLTAPERSDAYPVIGADAALKELNKAAGGAAGTGPGRIGGCATAVPLESERPAAPCEAKGGAGVAAAEPVEIDKAVFGLAVRSVEGKGALVPSWLFEVAPGGGAAPYTVTHPAVAPEFLTKAEPPHRELPGGPSPVGPGDSRGEEPGTGGSGSGKAGGGETGGEKTAPGTSRSSAIVSYTTDGRKLTLHFMGGVCSTYTPQVDESGTAVKVKLVVSHPDPDRMCVAIAKEQSVTAELAQPLGKRLVVDATTGEKIARRG
ncbi:hypothetical protein [Streptomyces corynorhini]|uniref:Large membrane protein n=1 Tax=Streptomyces corynorhini TaxID=2282652 RepID=A0A370BD51_9ACTN|nr:hypothetical protein [Streptomyces corynorhini]RDG38164.1 hypothetical protein DVH02_10770 [Streptomyces corynorhini]